MAGWQEEDGQEMGAVMSLPTRFLVACSLPPALKHTAWARALAALAQAEEQQPEALLAPHLLGHALVSGAADELLLLLDAPAISLQDEPAAIIRAHLPTCRLLLEPMENLGTPLAVEMVSSLAALGQAA